MQNLFRFPMNTFRLVLLTALSLFNLVAFAALDSQSMPAGTEQAAQASMGSIIQDCPECPELVVIPDGSFDMGSSTHYKNEQPIHRVTIGKPFAIGKTEITQGQWKAIMGNTPSHFSRCGENCPVEQVSWDDAQEYIDKLNARTGKQYRLPSEAEWEYACRAGGHQEYCGSDTIGNVAWYGTFTNDTTHPVATRQANAFGLYDMSGNVWEWVEDSYHNNYNDAPSDGSAWLGEGVMHVLRGGAWNGKPQTERAAARVMSSAENRIKVCGFRVARMLEAAADRP
jgi:formylglycine-generating enzyme required for sulfatase activity